MLTHLQVIDRVDDVSADVGLQLIEHPRGFDLVFDERVALAVGAQADAFPQIVDRRQMLDPQPVHHVEHPDALEQPHLVMAELLLLVVIRGFGQLHQVIDHLFAVGQPLDVLPREVLGHREDALDLLAESVQIPVAAIAG